MAQGLGFTHDTPCAATLHTIFQRNLTTSEAWVGYNGVHLANTSYPMAIRGHMMKKNFARKILPPLIILCPPRSFSSVVCAALGQHPELYSFPELNLFVSNTVGDLLEIEVLQEPQTGLCFPYSAGLLRVLMSLQNVEETDGALQKAIEWLQIRKSWSTQQVFDFLLEQVWPRRGIDKSPRTALSRTCMQRILDWYPQANFLHLTRHPVTNQRSLQAYWACLPPTISYSSQKRDVVSLMNFSAHLWYHVHQGILDFTRSLPADRALVMQGEDILQTPRTHLHRIAAWLGLRTDTTAIDAMTHPENSPYARIGILPVGLENDPKFLQTPHLRSVTKPIGVSMPSEWHIHPWLEAQIADLAAVFGYQ